MMSYLDVESDDVYVRHIVEVFSKAYPFTLRDWFVQNMMSDKEFADKLTKRITELGLTMPKSIEPKIEESTEEAEEENS